LAPSVLVPQQQQQQQQPQQQQQQPVKPSKANKPMPVYGAAAVAAAKVKWFV
jgi:hypothetical protein